MSEISSHTGQSSPRTRRSHSISSDRPSLTGFGGLLSPPTSISPDPAFIAASAASQIVTNDHDSQADAWFDQHGIEPSGETALVAPPALNLVNRFLDQLLFNFLSISKSTSLTSLRPAIAEVLKPKLAKDAISGADQELHEYLGGGEDDELLALHNGIEPSSDWDLELAWKRTRLRCMVYSSLGDMEEEDEDYYTEQEHLNGPLDSAKRFSNPPGVVSPAVAIFLTSVLEFMGEQVLIVAGQAAYHRLRTKHEKEDKEGTAIHSDIAERVVVEESDMERVALDRTLGRLWRAWKKRIRSPNTSISMIRSFSRESMQSQIQPSRAVTATPENLIDEDERRPSLAALLSEFDYATTIPLPMSDDDVREIEIPGVAKLPDDEQESIPLDGEDIRPRSRPKSWVFSTHLVGGPGLPNIPSQEAVKSSNLFTRKRSSSEPRLMWTPYIWRLSKAPNLSLPLDRTASTSDDQNSGSKLSDAYEGLEDSRIEKRDGEANNTGSSGATTPKNDGPNFEEGTTSNINSPLGQENSAENEQGFPSRRSALGVFGSAAAVGAAAVAGIVAVAKGEAPQTSGVVDEADSDEESTEEAQIMTSSRISIGGGINLDDGKDHSRRSSMRTPSVHSVRVIEVASTSRSRHSSVDAADYIPTGRPIVTSRPNSMHSPVLTEVQNTRITSPTSRGLTNSPVTRNTPSLSTKQARNTAEESIAEIEEKVREEKKLRSITNDEQVSIIPSSPTLAVAAANGVDATSAQSINKTSHFSTEDVNSTYVPTSQFVDEAEVYMVPTKAEPSKQSEIVEVTSTGKGVGAFTSPISNRLLYTQQSVDQSRVTSFQSNSKHISPPLPAKEESSKKSITESNPKSQRSIHTSGSGSSTMSHKLKPIRTSEESTSNVENKSQTFEQLIQSDQTIQFTLTPQTMRDIEAPESPRNISVSNSINGYEIRPQTGRSHSSSVSKFVGLQPMSTTDSPKSVKSAKPFKPIPHPTSNTGAKLRSNAPQPRDARVDRDSIGDFAEFIRSTGPSNPVGTTVPRTASTPISTNSNSRTTGAHGIRSGASSSLRRADSATGRTRLQAREAIVSRGDSISDLIDFVRSGPQLEKENHRIPRTVAPFRSTMDSDQMSGAVGGRAIDASLPDPRYSQATASVNSSVTSQSALLSSSRNKQLASQSKSNIEEEDMMPKRKTRRVRDPYAIDFSDDEDEFEAASKPKAVQEESLADFLRNVPPPPDSSPALLFESAPSNKSVKKKASSPGLMSRFGRSPSSPPLPPTPNKQDSQPGPNPSTSYAPIAAKLSTTLTPSRTQGGTNGPQVDSNRRKVAQKSYQPREAVYSSATRTSDLADFLMKSEPPSTMQAQPQPFTPTLQKDEASAFQRMFGRKKVH